MQNMFTYSCFLSFENACAEMTVGEERFSEVPLSGVQ